MSLMIKWRFRDTRSLSKNVMKSYANYVERQVLERVEKTSAFLDYDSIFTETLTEDQFIERLLSTQNAHDEHLAFPEYSLECSPESTLYTTELSDEKDLAYLVHNTLSESSQVSPLDTFQNQNIHQVSPLDTPQTQNIPHQSSTNSDAESALKEAANQSQQTVDSSTNNPHLDLLYQRYLEDLESAPALFSAPRSDISELKKSLYNHEGNVWIPIISLKESEALSLGLTSEDEWKSKARDIMPVIANSLKIPESNLNFLVGFHEKPDSKQNKSADAGSQPHLHFIIWEKEPRTQKAKISTDELKKLRKNITDVFTSDYSHTLISNQLDEVSKTKKSEKNFRKISDACSSIALTLKHFSDSIPTLEDFEYHTRDVSRIIDRKELGESLTSTQSALIVNHKLDSQTKLVNRLRECYEVKDGLGEIAEEVLNSTNLDATVIKILETNPQLKERLISKLEYKASTDYPIQQSYSFLKINERIKQIAESINDKTENKNQLNREKIRELIKEILESNLYKSLSLAEVKSDSDALTNVGIVSVVEKSAPNPLATEEQLLTSWATVAQFAASKNVPMMNLIDAAWACNRNQNLNVNPFDIYAYIEGAYEEYLDAQTTTSPKILDEALSVLGYTAKSIESEIDDAEMWKRVGWSAEETLRMFIPSEFRKKEYSLITTENQILDVINEYTSGVLDEEMHTEEIYVRKK